MMTATQPNQLEIDQQQAIAHLTALGYLPGEAIYVRYINSTLKKSVKAPRLDFAQVKRYQGQGYDVYFVVNGGGDTDEAVTTCRAIFYEHDNLDKESQLYLWEQLGLPEPTIQVDTGGKSVHSYWVFTDPVKTDDWRRLQADLLNYSDADRSIKNPSRVLRLAGSRYMKGDNSGSKVATIVSNSGKRYSYEQLRVEIPEPESASVIKVNYQPSISDDVPLYQCLTKDDRALIDGGIGEGQRNSKGAKLARNLIGTVARLAHLGVRCEGDSRALFDVYCAHCSPPVDAKEAEAIWRSAEKDNPTASLSDEAIENCVKSWQRQQRTQGRQAEFNISGEPASQDVPNSFDPDVEFTQKILKSLYGDKPWICVNDQLYFWNGTHYEHSPDGAEQKRIRNFCNGYAVKLKDDSMKFPYAKPGKVKQAMDWVKMSLWVDPKETNPAGLNCTNGILHLSWILTEPRWELKPHDPALYYLYEPVATYDPKANSEHCDRLLAALDTPQREIFLRTIAASLDLPTVRKHKGRLVRGLLMRGDGNNGKDSLREIVSMMYGGVGLTGCTLTDFATYDDGRKFPLSRLQGSRVNWATENANTAKLDRIQSIKAFLTGDTLQREQKGKDEIDFTPTGIGLFNINDTPNLQASLEAIQSRWGVLSFTKTFKIGADPTKGELEADPRFKYDPDFMRIEVLPAFLNRVLAALTNLMCNGIDYKCTQQALEAIQAENSHLFQFCQDVGLSYNPDGILTAGEIWQILEQWYQDNGTLTYEEGSNGKKKSVWFDQSRKSDANVKAANQVIARFQAIFPKVKRVTVGKGQVALQGISFSGAISEASEAVAGQLVRQEPLSSKDGEAITPILSIDGKKFNCC